MMTFLSFYAGRFHSGNSFLDFGKDEVVARFLLLNCEHAEQEKLSGTAKKTFQKGRATKTHRPPETGRRYDLTK